MTQQPGDNAMQQTVTLSDERDSVFEVFQQDRKRDRVPHHGGNLHAPDPELAVQYAREFYARRQESDLLWIIARNQLWEIQNASESIPYSLNDVYPHRAPACAAPPRLYAEDTTTFAVFGQLTPGKPMEWLYDISTPFTLLEAAQSVCQNMSSHSEAYVASPRRFWLCPRNCIMEVKTPDLLHPPLDRSYRRLDGYNIREKLHIARERTASAASEHPQHQTGGEPL
jgi:Uncharacterized enzyme of phenylacetate metabolism